MGRTQGLARFTTAATTIEGALETTLRDPANRTRDLGGATSTIAFTDQVIAHLKN